MVHSFCCVKFAVSGVLLFQETMSYPQQLVSNTCSLLAALISELAASATGSDTEITPPSRPLLITPNRFTRTSTSAYWNTGQGSPEAICFCVDRPGIVIAGVGLYAGQGQYDYEIDILDEVILMKLMIYYRYK